MPLVETDDGVKLECVVCEIQTTLDGVWTAVSTGDTLDADADDDDPGWYLHIHEFNPDTGVTIDTEATYAFCPDHLPDASFPTAETNPGFDIEVAVAQVKDEYK